jgi:excisionase family DNA binding protein
MYKREMANLLTTKQAAEKLKMTDRHIRLLIAQGKLKASKVGRDYVIDENDLSAAVVYGKKGRPPKNKDAKA